MSKFITPLVAELVDEKKNLWRIKSPLVYQSETLGREVRVPPGFVTDFASVPRIPIIYELCGGKADQASIVHDWLYASKEVPRPVADAVLREAMLATDIGRWRVVMFYVAVRLLGKSRYGSR